MPVIVNLREAEKKEIFLSGELSARELDLEELDELISVPGHLAYQLKVELMDGGALVTGRLEVRLVCECVRCLKAFDFPLVLADWVCHVPLVGEECAVVHKDCVDLTPFIREDIVLGFPRHPLCDSNCRGLQQAPLKSPQNPGAAPHDESGVSVWAELNKLKF